MKKMHPKLSLNDVIGETLQSSDSILPIVLHGHLAIEALLVELIQFKTTSTEILYRSFPSKTEFLETNSLISKETKIALDSINSLRNRYAHELGYKSTFSDIYSLLKIVSIGIDFTDPVESMGEKDAQNYYYDRSNLISEIIYNILVDLAVTLDSIGGRSILSEYKI